MLPEVISEDTCTVFEYLQCVKSWEGSCRITVIAYKDNVNGPNVGGDRRNKFFNIRNKGLLQERHGSGETGWTSFLFIEKRVAFSIDRNDAAFAARKCRKVDFV